MDKYNNIREKFKPLTDELKQLNTTTDIKKFIVDKNNKNRSTSTKLFSNLKLNENKEIIKKDHKNIGSIQERFKHIAELRKNINRE